MSRIDYASIAETRRGTLQIIPFGTLLYACCIHGKSVELKIEREGVRKTVFLEDGRPTECRSNLLHETLGHFLLRAGRLGEDELKRYAAEAMQRKERIGTLLVERGVVDAMYLYKALLRNLAQKILECFTWLEGEFEVLPFRTARRSSLRINVPKLVFRGLTKFSTQDHVEAGLDGLLGRELGLQASPPIALSAIELSPSQRRLIDDIRAHAKTEEVLEQRGLSRDESARVVYALFTMGLIRPWDDRAQLDSRGDGAPAAAGSVTMPEPDLVAIDSSLSDWETPITSESPPESPSADAPVAAGEQHQDAASRVLGNEIVSEYLALRERDAFELLGLSEDASAEAVRSAYSERCDRYAPSRFSSDALASVADMADELLRATIDAYFKLRSDEGRRALAMERRRALEEPATPATSPDFSIASQNLAREHARQAYERLGNGNFGAAGGLFALAADSDPDEPIYQIHLAYARFRETPKRYAGPALDTMRRLGGIQATFYAAEISHSLGRLDDAQELFLQAARRWANRQGETPPA